MYNTVSETSFKFKRIQLYNRKCYAFQEKSWCWFLLSLIGANVRIDTTLVGFDQMNWQRGRQSFVFKGESKLLWGKSPEQCKTSFMILFSLLDLESVAMKSSHDTSLISIVLYLSRKCILPVWNWSWKEDVLERVNKTEVGLPIDIRLSISILQSLSVVVLECSQIFDTVLFDNV